jgi:hypothetical protein
MDVTAKASRTLRRTRPISSRLLNPSLPVEDVAAAWRDSQLAQMTAGPSLRA